MTTAVARKKLSSEGKMKGLGFGLFLLLHVLLSQSCGAGGAEQNAPAAESAELAIKERPKDPRPPSRKLHSKLSNHNCPVDYCLMVCKNSDSCAPNFVEMDGANFMSGSFYDLFCENNSRREATYDAFITCADNVHKCGSTRLTLHVNNLGRRICYQGGGLFIERVEPAHTCTNYYKNKHTASSNIFHKKSDNFEDKCLKPFSDGTLDFLKDTVALE